MIDKIFLSNIILIIVFWLIIQVLRCIIGDSNIKNIITDSEFLALGTWAILTVVSMPIFLLYKMW